MDKIIIIIAVFAVLIILWLIIKSLIQAYLIKLCINFFIPRTKKIHSEIDQNVH